MTTDRPPRKWDGWFEEHPDGLIFFLLTDGTQSTVFKSYDEIEEWLWTLAERQDAGENIDLAQIIRSRYGGDSGTPEGYAAMKRMLSDPKLYPPEEES